MDVTVDVTDQEGKVLADASSPSAATVKTAVFDAPDGQADEAVRRIIASQLGHRVAASAKAKTTAYQPAEGTVGALAGAVAASAH
jgi:hypothetical protein